MSILLDTPNSPCLVPLFNRVKNRGLEVSVVDRVVIEIMVTPKQRDAFRIGAEMDGMKMATFIRHTAIERCRVLGIEIEDDSQNNQG